MTKNIPAFLARTQFGQILDRVSKDNERFVITKKGEVTAAILWIDDFLKTISEATPESLRVLQSQAKSSGANKLTIEQNEKEIDAVRKKTSHTNI